MNNFCIQLYGIWVGKQNLDSRVHTRFSIVFLKLWFVWRPSLIWFIQSDVMMVNFQNANSALKVNTNWSFFFKNKTPVFCLKLKKLNAIWNCPNAIWNCSINHTFLKPFSLICGSKWVFRLWLVFRLFFSHFRFFINRFFGKRSHFFCLTFAPNFFLANSFISCPKLSILRDNFYSISKYLSFFKDSK